VNYPALRYAIDECTLPSSGRHLLTVMAYRADRDSGCCWASSRHLAQRTGLDRKTVRHWLNKLVACSELEIVEKGAGARPTMYLLTSASGGVSHPPVVGESVTHYASDGELVGESTPASGGIGQVLVGELVPASGGVPTSGPAQTPDKGFKVTSLEGIEGVGAREPQAARADNGTPPRVSRALFDAIARYVPDAVFDPAAGVGFPDGSWIPHDQEARAWLAWAREEHKRLEHERAQARAHLSLVPASITGTDGP
jgi:hypothetical protein